MSPKRSRKNIWLGMGLATLVLLIAVRILAPPLILKQINKGLAEASPVYAMHIDRLHLSLLRMAYRFEGLQAKLKSDDTIFAEVEWIDVSIAWSELFRGRVLTDVVAQNGRFILGPKVIADSKSPEAKPKEDAKNVADSLFPVRVSAITLRQSAVQFGEFLHQPDSPLWRIANINAMVTNLTPTLKVPFTFFTLRGTMLDSSVLKLAGKAKRLDDPLAWEVDAELNDFDLVRANPLLVLAIPLSFSAGHLDMYSEVRSEQGKIEGYVKPFFKKAHVIGDKSDFKGIKHFAIEVVAAIGNAVLRRSKDETLATKVPFYYEGGNLKVRTDVAIDKAIDHGFGKPISKGLEDNVNLR